MDVPSVQSMLGYTFQNIMLLYEALSGAGVPQTRKGGNKALAKVGTNVLQLVVSRCWYPTQQATKDLDGQSKKRTSQASLAAACRASGLDAFIICNPCLAHEPTPDSILGDTILAVIAAVWLDSEDDLEQAKAVIIKLSILETDEKGILDWFYFADLI